LGPSDYMSSVSIITGRLSRVVSEEVFADTAGNSCYTEILQRVAGKHVCPVELEFNFEL